MGLHIHLDPVGGIAGDMFISALIDARPELAAGLIAALEAIGAPPEVTYRLSDHHDGALGGKRFTVTEPEHDPRAHSTAFRALREHLRDSAVAAPVKARAIAIFTTLAEAEARVHGVAVEDVAFHELGAWDSVADVVGAAHLIETLGAPSWSCGPLPQGAGTVAKPRRK